MPVSPIEMRYIAQVVPVHGQDVIVVIQVPEFELLGVLAFHRDALRFSHLGHTPIGLLPDMPGAGSGGGDFKVVQYTGLARLVPKNAFGKRAPANVAHAYEHDPDERILIFQPLLPENTAE